MLIFKRKRGQAIIIGDDIKIIILEIEGNKIKIGIKAPVEITVHRDEVYDKIQKEKEENKDA